MTEETAARLRRPRLRGDDKVIGVILAALERAAPGAILESAARVQLRALGSPDAPE